MPGSKTGRTDVKRFLYAAPGAGIPASQPAVRGAGFTPSLLGVSAPALVSSSCLGNHHEVFAHFQNNKCIFKRCVEFDALFIYYLAQVVQSKRNENEIEIEMNWAFHTKRASMPQRRKQH